MVDKTHQTELRNVALTRRSYFVTTTVLRTTAMATRLLLVAALLLPLASLGCRACQSCYDNSSPLAGNACGCNTCGSGRSGSAISGGATHVQYGDPVYSEGQIMGSPEIVMPAN